MSVDHGDRSESGQSRSGSFWLTVLILVAMVLGIGVGQWIYQLYGPHSNIEGASETLNTYIGVFDFIGTTFFMGLLKMVLIPLVASSVIVGVSSIGDPSRLGYVGGMTLVYYFSTMFSAVLLGLLLVTSIVPGHGIAESFREAKVAEYNQTQDTNRQRIEGASGTGILGAFRSLATQLIPTNPIAAAADGQMLPVISFSLLLGIVITVIGDKGIPLAQFFESLFAAIMKLVEWILWLAPIGVFALMAWSVAKIGLGSLWGPLSKFVITVLAGLAIHGVVVLPLVLAVFGRSNPWKFLVSMRAALLTASPPIRPVRHYQ